MSVLFISNVTAPKEVMKYKTRRRRRRGGRKYKKKKHYNELID